MIAGRKSSAVLVSAEGWASIQETLYRLSVPGMRESIRKGMAERYDGIRADLEGADAAKADARAEVAKYEAALVEVRAEAAKRVDAARVTLDRERGEAIAAANQRIAAKKAEAEAAAAAERAAARDQISAAVTSVTATATSIAVGKQADNSVVTQAVAQAMQSTGAR